MIYLYKCPECGTEYDKVHAMSCRPEFVCEVKECGGALQRKPTPVKFKIKGYSEANGYTRMETETVPGKEFSEELST